MFSLNITAKIMLLSWHWELNPSHKRSTLSSTEQTEKNAFLTKNLYTDKIHPLKSLMTILVFFIKKKDSLLWLV